MKKEDLIALGLTEEQAKSVMAAHGKTVTVLNSQVSALQASEEELKTQNAKHTKDLEELQKNSGKNETLAQQIKDLQEENEANALKYQESLVAVQRDSALNNLLSESKVKNAKAVSALLDPDKIIFKDGELSGVKEQIEALKQSDAYLFDLGTKQKGYEPAGGSAITNYKTFEEAMEKGDVDGFLRQQIEESED